MQRPIINTDKQSETGKESFSAVKCLVSRDDVDVPRNNIIKQLSSAISEQKNTLIITAITHKLGTDDWDLSDVKKRCSIAILPDKTEVFSFDGVNLLRFYPIDISMSRRFKVKATHNYKILYS